MLRGYATLTGCVCGSADVWVRMKAVVLWRRWICLSAALIALSASATAPFNKPYAALSSEPLSWVDTGKAISGVALHRGVLVCAAGL